MQAERLHLAGFERMKYFAPVAICGYLAALCMALIITSAFLDNIRDAIAITAAGIFGLLLSGGLGAAILRVQLRELRYVVVQTRSDAIENFAAVLRMAESSEWNVTVKVPGRCLEARTRGSLLSEGEYVVVRFRQNDVLVACITDPSVGFSLVGRRRCLQHRERVRQAVMAAA
jgi:methyl coenzyme M reductase beta subunit